MNLKRFLILFLGFALVLAAPIWATKVADNILKWPSNQSSIFLLSHTENNRFNFKDSWSGNVISNSSVELNTLSASSSVATIDKKFVIESINGDVLFSLNQKFNINRYYRRNLPSNDDVIDTYSYFPPNTQKTSYLWTTGTMGSPIKMSFERENTIDGIKVYEFTGKANNVDDTSGYEFLPLVPEKYKVLSNVVISVSVEPATGDIVNYSDTGTSYYSDKDLNRVWDIAQWSNRYTENTVKNNLVSINKKMEIVKFHRITIPLALFFAGSLLISLSVFIMRRK